MNVFLRFCFSAAGIFAGIAVGSWVINKAYKELDKVISRQFEREKFVKEEED